MRKPVVCLFLIVLSIPVLASAQTIDYDIGFPFSDASIREFVSGVMTTVNIATSSSGGVVVGGGSATTGDSSASVNVRNIINSSGDKNTVNVQVTTESDGVVKTESVKQTFEGGGEVRVTRSFGTGGVEVKVLGSDDKGTKSRVNTSFRNWWKQLISERKESSDSEVDVETTGGAKADTTAG